MAKDASMGAHSDEAVRVIAHDSGKRPDAGTADGSHSRRDSADSAALEHWPGKSYLLIKSCFDFISSLLVSIVLLIPMLILMLVIVIKDPGNPIYLQERVGKGGKPIRVAKLRTMRRGADHLDDMLTPEQLEEYRKEYKLHDDPRLIGWKKPGDGSHCFGGFLRRYSLDELPQIFYNIFLRHDMSVVGPRPVLREELERNYTPDERRAFTLMKPGLTGYWQAYARNGAEYENGKRQQMELYYIEHCSIKLDIKILFRSIGAVLSGRDSY